MSNHPNLRLELRWK